jgi:hypothetical protein
MTTYKIIDSKTNTQVGNIYKSRSRATARADKMDMAYGSYRYIVQPVFA